MLIAASGFRAEAYAARQEPVAPAPSEMLSRFDEDDRVLIGEVRARIAELEETIVRHRPAGAYTAARVALHRTIVAGFLSAEQVEAATPAGPPSFIMLGGRGGSGKSWFHGHLFNPAEFLVIDPDAIKAMLPGYEGWNAFAYHEESSDLAELLLRTAAALGLNTVLDVTMRSVAGVREKIALFAPTHRLRVHYMYLPRGLAAERATRRFLKPGGRYVPVEVILGNVSSEATFDAVRAGARGWSFRDNDVARGAAPTLVSAAPREEAGLIAGR